MTTEEISHFQKPSQIRRRSSDTGTPFSYQLTDYTESRLTRSALWALHTGVVGQGPFATRVDVWASLDLPLAKGSFCAFGMRGPRDPIPLGGGGSA